MTTLARKPCAVCGPESLHKYDRCIRCYPVAESRGEAAKAKRSRAFVKRGKKPNKEFTEHEKRVLQLVAQGVERSLIAERMKLQLRDVTNAIQSAKRRKGCASVPELMRVVMVEKFKAPPTDRESVSGVAFRGPQSLNDLAVKYTLQADICPAGGY